MKLKFDPNQQSQVMIYQTKDGKTRVDVQFLDETVWLTQKLMAELFQVTVPTINEHLKNIFETGELEEESVIRKFRITAADGKAYNTNHYNLDVIISLGYRVNSNRATQFRILNLIVSLYLDFAELQASNERPMTMKDWIGKLDEFLKLSEKELLNNTGSISARRAKKKAKSEFEKYRKKRIKQYVSDFDRQVKKIAKKKE